MNDVDALKSNAAESEQAIAKCRAEINEASGYTERLNLVSNILIHIIICPSSPRPQKGYHLLFEIQGTDDGDDRFQIIPIA